jgi:hypothetical protein
MIGGQKMGKSDKKISGFYLGTAATSTPAMCWAITSCLFHCGEISIDALRARITPRQVILNEMSAEGDGPDKQLTDSLAVLLRLDVISNNDDRYKVSANIGLENQLNIDEFRLILCRAIVDESVRSLRSENDPSDLIKYLVLTSELPHDEIYGNEHDVANAIQRRFNDVGLNAEKWNSLKKWALFFGFFARSMAPRNQTGIRIDPTGIVRLVGSQFADEVDMEDFVNRLASYYPFRLNATFFDWLLKSFPTMEFGKTKFGSPLLWSINRLTIAGDVRTRLADDTPKTVYELLAGRASHIKFGVEND